jgi:HK97 family phage major capsid protein
MELKQVLEAITGVEAKLSEFSQKAEAEAKLNGKASQDTLAAVEGLGVKQRELADRLMALEQKGSAGDDTPAVETMGQQFTKSDAYKSFANGSSQKARVEVKNTVTGSSTTVAPDRRPGVVPGAAQLLTLESLFNALPTTSNAVEFTRENVFTNNAAEAAEGASKAESALTFTLVNQPVSTVAHWIKISRQLASDNAALAAYINTRMIYGVNRRVEGQLAVGDGSAPNISGIFKSGNYTAHGYLSGAIGSVLPKCVLIRKVIADLKAAGYMADAVLLNPVDWAAIEIELLTTVAGQTLLSYNNAGEPRLFGVPVVESVGVAADTFAVGAFGQAGTIYNREGVTVDLSESDGDNFTKNLVTIRAERRLALAIEVPGAIRGGDLTPAAS